MQRLRHSQPIRPSLGIRYECRRVSLHCSIVTEHWVVMPESEKADEHTERLNKLSAFQLLMIRHAMKCERERRSLSFASLTTMRTVPSVKRIVYSTCSIHATENEHVVREALKTEECRHGQFRLASPKTVLPSWPRRGIPAEMDNPGTHKRNFKIAFRGSDDRLP